MKYTPRMILLLALILHFSLCKVTRLDAKNLHDFTRDPSFWLIQVAKPICPDCKTHNSQLDSLSIVFEGVVNVGQIDQNLIPRAKTSRNPTYIFGRANDPDHVKMFQEDFDGHKLAQFVVQQLQQFLNQRIDTAYKQSGRAYTTKSSQPSLVELTDSTFETTVLKSKEAWLVSFYSPNCGHCRNLQPQYNKLPKLMGKRAKVGRLDGTIHSKMMQKYNVKGFPTIYFFGRSEKKPILYEGERTAEAIAKWLSEKDIAQEKVQFKHLTKEVYEEECRGNYVCMVFILEHAHDEKGRIRVEELIGKPSGKPIKWFYSGRLARLQSALMIQDRSCPKLVQFWHDLNSYRLYRGKLKQQEIQEHLKGIFQRKQWVKMHQPLIKNIFSPMDEQF